MNFGWLLFSFKGRENRAKFWLVIAILFIIGLPITIRAFQHMNEMMPQMQAAQTQCAQQYKDATAQQQCAKKAINDLQIKYYSEQPAAIKAIFLIVELVGFWISLANYTKRFHDIDKSGWNLLWLFLPIAGVIMVIYWTWIKKGTTGPNRFGLDPLQGNAI